MHTGETLKEFMGHQKSVTDVLIIDGTQKAVSASLDHTLKVWDLESFELIRSIDNVRSCMKLLPSTKPSEMIAVTGSEQKKGYQFPFLIPVRAFIKRSQYLFEKICSWE